MSNEHNNAPAVAQGLERYEPTVMVEKSRGRLTATCAVMKPKEDGRWVRLRDLTATPAPAPAQEVGLTGPAVAWRMRDTGFRRPKYVYFDTKEQAVAHAAHLLQSRDDGHLTELTPLCEASTSTDLLDALRDNSWKLEPFEIPTGQGDADIGWRVVGFYMGKPKERTEATVYTDDPAAAIIAALRAKGGK